MADEFVDFDPLAAIAALIVGEGKGSKRKATAVLAGVLAVASAVAEGGSDINRNSDLTFLGFALMAASTAAEVVGGWGQTPKEIRDASMSEEDITDLLREFFTMTPLGAEGEEE